MSLSREDVDLIQKWKKELKSQSEIEQYFINQVGYNENILKLVRKAYNCRYTRAELYIIYCVTCSSRHNSAKFPKCRETCAAVDPIR